MIRSLQIRALHQGGVFGRAQAVSAGYTAGQIRNRIRRGQRREVLPRVYAATSTPLDPLAQFWAAHLSAGPVSVISHTTAARLWELPVPPDGLVHLSVPPGRRPRTGAPVRVHRVVVGDSDRAGIDGLPVTSRAATVLDCLPLLDRSDGAKLLDRAVQQGWLRPVHVERRLAESPAGTATSRCDGSWPPSDPVPTAQRNACCTDSCASTASTAGDRSTPSGCHPAGSQPLTFPASLVAIEVDGWAWHIDPERFQLDRSRQNEMVTAGWTVLRFTWTDLTERPDLVLRTVRRALATPRLMDATRC